MNKAEIHLNINNPNLEMQEIARKIVPANIDLFFYTNEDLEDYVKSRNIEPNLENYKIWEWIYHIILYHKLYTERNVDYLLTYDDDILFNAGIKNARAVITCLPKDADNVYVVLAAREANNKLLIVSRASTNAAVSKLKMAGANNVIMPDSIGGSHMASLIANPDVMEFLDIIRVQGYEGANIESISYDELPKEFQDKTIRELEAREITGATIIGFKGTDGNYIINPGLETKVGPGSKLFILGSTGQIKKLVAHFSLNH